MDFGAHIRQLRLGMGMSQVEFAEKLGLSKQILSLYEAGKRSPKIAQVKKLAEILKVTVDYLLGDSAEEAAFYSICSAQDKPFYKIFIEVTYDELGLDIPGVVRVTGLTDRQVRTIIARRMKEAPRASAVKAQSTSGNRPLGYKTEPDKKFVIDPETAPTVRLVYGLYAQGQTMAQIIRTLNAKGLRTLRGRSFTNNSLRTHSAEE